MNDDAKRFLNKKVSPVTKNNISMILSIPAQSKHLKREEFEAKDLCEFFELKQ